jgi:hypothetical protein
VSEAQSPECRESVLPASVRARLAMEAGVTLDWCQCVNDRGDVIGVDRYGVSLAGLVVMRRYGIRMEHVCQWALALALLRGMSPADDPQHGRLQGVVPQAFLHDEPDYVPDQEGLQDEYA